MSGTIGVVTTTDTTDLSVAKVLTGQTVTPFAHLTITDTVPTDIVSALLVVSSGYSSSGSITFTGTAAQVQADFNNFTATALTTGPGSITAYIAQDGSPIGSTTSGAGAGKATFAGVFRFDGVVPGGVAPTGAQIDTLANDTAQYYADQQAGASTGLDASKLVNDLTGLAIDKPTLGQMLTAALANDAGANAGVLGRDLANVFYGTINGDLHAPSGSLGGDLKSMINEAVAVGGTYSGLAATEAASTALTQTLQQYNLTG